MVWGLCHVFENTLYLIRDMMEHSAVPSNLSVPNVSEPDRAVISARAQQGLSLGSIFNFSA